LRNTNFKLNNGYLSYDDIAEIEVDINQLEDRILRYGDIILEKSGGSETQAIGRVVLFDKQDDEIYSYSNFCSRIRVIDKNKINPIFLWFILNNFYNQGGTISLQKGIRLLNIDLEGYKKIKIPIPPLDIQQKIVDEIEEVERNNNQQITNINSCSKKISIILDSFNENTYKLGQLITLEYGKALPKYNRQDGKYPVVGSNGIDGYHKEYMLEGPNIIVGRKGSVGKINLIKENCTPIDTCFYVNIDNNKLNFKYCYYLLKKLDLEKLNTGMGPGGLNRNVAYNIDVKIPTLSNQQKIVSQIEELEKQIDEAQKIIDNSKQQKQDILDKYIK